MVWFGLVGLVWLVWFDSCCCVALRYSTAVSCSDVVECSEEITVRNSNNILLRSSLRDLLRSTSYSGCVERSPDKMIRMTPR